MSIQKPNTPATTGTDNHPSTMDIENPNAKSVEAANSESALDPDGDTPSSDELDSTGGEDENADVDTDHVDMITDVDTDADTENEADTEDEDEDDSGGEPEPEPKLTWDFPLSSDSTALNLVTDVMVEDDGDLLGDSDLLDSVEAFVDGKTKFDSITEKLQAGRELTRKFFAQQNLAMSGVFATYAGYTVQTGKLLIALKPLVKATGEKWEPWAAENLKFMAPRTRQACMQLAKVSGIEKHLHFNKERLLLLAGAVKGADGDDPIGDFLRRHNLGFDPTEEIDLDAYKDAVDLVLDFERLKKAGLDVEMESLKQFRADGNKVTTGLIKVLKAVKAANGDPNKHLTDPSSGGSDDGEKKAKSFKKIATTLAGTIDWIDGHREFIDHVDLDTIDELSSKLEALKALITASDNSEAQN